MESLHYGKILGKDRTNIGFCWEIATGVYYANLGVRGSRGMGMRSRAPPVADAARRSIRSGRKNRASEQRDDFFGHRKAARTAICQGVHRRKSRCRGRNLNKQLFAQAAPPPLRGRGTGRGQMRLRLLWERICAQYGRCFASFVSSTASDRKGFVKGEAVPLDRILVPFVRTKGTPPRRAVLTMPLQKAPRRRQAR